MQQCSLKIAWPLGLGPAADLLSRGRVADHRWPSGLGRAGGDLLSSGADRPTERQSKYHGDAGGRSPGWGPGLGSSGVRVPEKAIFLLSIGAVLQAISEGSASAVGPLSLAL